MEFLKYIFFIESPMDFHPQFLIFNFSFLIKKRYSFCCIFFITLLFQRFYGFFLKVFSFAEYLIITVRN